MNYNRGVIVGSIILSFGLLGCLPKKQITPKERVTKIKKLQEYAISDFHFDTRVKYFDIKESGYSYPFYRDLKAYKSLTQKERDSLDRAEATSSKEMFLEEIASIPNFRYIDYNINSKNISNRDEALNLIGEIDNPAKLQLAIWLHTHKNATNFTPVDNYYNFTVRFTDIVSGLGLSCGDYVYKGAIDMKGNLMQYLLTESPTGSMEECSLIV